MADSRSGARQLANGRVSETQVARLRRLLEEGTPGPWVVDKRNANVILPTYPEPEWVGVAGTRWDVFVGQVSNRDRAQFTADAALIVAMHEALPALLTAIDLLRELEWSQGGNDGYNEMCPICWAEKPDTHTADCKLAALLGVGKPE